MKSPINLAASIDFLNALDEREVFCFRTFTDDLMQRKKLRGKRDPLAENFRGAFDEVQEDLIKFNRRGAAVTVVINEGGQRDEKIKSICALSCDIDSKEAMKRIDGLLTPHILCKTSPNHWHAYWKVSDCEVSAFKALQQAIAKKFRCDSICNPSRAMRLPGFVHQKTENIYVSRVVAIKDHDPYTVAQVTEGLALQSVAVSPPLQCQEAVTVTKNHHADVLNLTRKTATMEVTEGLPKTAVLKMLREIAKGRYVGRSVPFDEIERAHNDAVTKMRGGMLGVADEIVDTRESVLFLKGREFQATDEAEKALLKHRKDIYVRGQQLVRVASNQLLDSSAHGRLVVVNDDWLTDALGRVARCEKLGKHGSRETVEWPKQIARNLIVRATDLAFPRLRGVVQTPLLRLDGTVRTRPGYDAKTNLIVDIKPDWPRIPKHPTRNDARKAGRKLYRIICKYPFETRADRSVAFSAMLTAVARPILPTAPMHAFSSPVAGSGKSKLSDICSIIGTGKVSSPLQWPPQMDEAEKRLGAALIDGASVICFDNVQVPLAGALLCSVLTQLSAKVRPLGESKLVEVPVAASLFANGINLMVSADATRRVLVSEIDPKLESPHLTKFSFDPVVLATKHRVELVNAALTIMSAYLQSKMAKRKSLGMTPLGSFEEWSRVVRDSLVWSGAADPTDVMSRVRDTDPDTANLRGLMQAWNEAFGTRPKTAAQAVAATEKLNAKYRALGDVLKLVAVGSNGKVSSRSLGTYLNGRVKKILGAFKFIRVSDAQGGIGRYALMPAKQEKHSK